MIEVTVLELWISAVATSPIISPTKGLVAKAKSSLALAPAAALKPPPMAPTAASSKYTNTTTVNQESHWRLAGWVGSCESGSCAIEGAWLLIQGVLFQ